MLAYRSTVQPHRPHAQTNSFLWQINRFSYRWPIPSRGFCYPNAVDWKQFHFHYFYYFCRRTTKTYRNSSDELHFCRLSETFWVQAVSRICHIVALVPQPQNGYLNSSHVPAQTTMTTLSLTGDVLSVVCRYAVRVWICQQAQFGK